VLTKYGITNAMTISQIAPMPFHVWVYMLTSGEGRKTTKRTPIVANPVFPLSKFEKVFAWKNASAETKAEIAEPVAN